MKATFLEKKDEDLLEKIKTLSYLVFKKTDNGAELLQALFDYHLCYCSPYKGDLSHNLDIAMAHEVGGQDMIRMLYNYSVEGEILVRGNKNDK